MDGRGGLRLALCLLSGAVGCQHQVTTLSPTAATLSMSKPEAAPDPGQIKKASSQPTKEPPPAVLVSWGDFKAGEAFAPDIPPERQQQIRDAAREDYERALKSDPKNVRAYQGLARLATAMRNQTRAIELYQTALQLAPNNAALWYEMAMSHNYQRNWGPALQCLNRAAQLDPANRSYSNTLGIVLAETGRYDESLGCFIRANGEAVGYLRLAQTLQHLQQPDLSRQYMEVALQKDPNLSSTMVMRNEMKGPPSAPVQHASYQNIPAGAPTPVPEPSSQPLQHTSYQAPSVPQSPTTLSGPADYTRSPPRVIRLDSVSTKVPADAPPAPQPFVVPPPPQVNLHYPEPTPQ